MTSPNVKDLRVHIRWMIRGDMPEIVYIEEAGFEYPWSEEDFLQCLRQRNCIGMVAECDERVVGFMIYELHKSCLKILNFAVHPDFQRHGVGRAMTEKLANKLAHRRRTRVVLAVRETNLGAQLFFRSQGYRATSVKRNFYHDSPEDAYVMEFDFRWSLAAEASLQNRITRLAG